MTHLGDSLDFYQAVYNFGANVGQFYYHPVFLLTPMVLGPAATVLALSWCSW